MADKLTITIEAQTAEARAQLKQLQANLHEVTMEGAKISVAHKAAGAAAAEHHAILGKLAAGAKSAGSEIGKLGGFLKNLASNAMGGFGPLGLLLGAGGAVLGLVETVKETLAWNDAVYRLSVTMNGSAESASKWLAIGRQLGIDTDAITKSVRFLSQHIDQMSPILHAMGVATVDASGNLLSMDQILINSRGWFQDHANSTLTAARAIELFGRGGLALLPLLTASNTSIEALTAEAKKLGLVINNDTMVANRQFGFELGRLGEIIHGVSLAIGNALLPALAGLANALGNFLLSHIEDIKSALVNMIAFVASALNVLFGLKIDISEVAKALDSASAASADYGDQTDTLGAQQEALAGQSRGLAEATRVQTEAMADQIQVLRDANTALDEQVRLMEEQNTLISAQESFDNKMHKLAEEKAAKIKEIDKIRSEYQNALLIGDFLTAQTLNDQLATAQQQLGDKESETAQTQSDQQRKLKLDNLKSTVNAEKTANNEKIRALEDETKAIQRAAQAQSAAMGSAAAQMKQAVVGSFAAIQGAAQTHGHLMDETLTNLYGSAGGKAGAAFGVMIKAELKQLAKDGIFETIGEAIGQGIVHGIGQKLTSWLTDGGSQQGGLHARDGSTGYGGRGYALGGTITGGPGQGYGAPVPMIGHVGETVRTPSQERMLSQGAAKQMGGGIVNQYFYIYEAQDMDEEAIARASHRELTKALGIL